MSRRLSRPSRVLPSQPDAGSAERTTVAEDHRIKAPDAISLLRVWEESQGALPIRRALALLDATAPQAQGAWGGASIGQRDARLLDLYEALFGSRLQTVTRCPSCREVLETDFVTSDIRVPPAAPQPSTHEFHAERCSVQYRLPNSDDLLHVASSVNDAARAEHELLQRCVIEIHQAGKRQSLEWLPPAVIEGLTEDMAAQDPGADLQIRLNCPVCSHAWSVLFDIVSYFWSALDDWAQRALADVHLLARAYGWSEREILGLSATRRQHYIEMVRA